MRKSILSFCWLATPFSFMLVQPSSTSAQSFLDRLEQRLQQIVPTEPGDEETLPPDVGRPGYLGLVGDEVSGGGGVRIESVRPGGPAARAGMRVGDRIVELNGALISDLDDMARGLERQWVRSRLQFRVVRDGEQRTVGVVLGERPVDRGTLARDGGPPTRSDDEGVPSLQPPAVPRPPIASDPFLPPAVPLFGATLAEVSPTLQRRYGLTASAGAIVVDLEPGTPAGGSRLLRGALITSINGMPIRHPDDVGALMVASEPGETWEVSYLVRQQRYETRLVLAALEVPDAVPDTVTDALPRPPASDDEALSLPRPPGAGDPRSTPPLPGGSPLDLEQRLGQDGRRPLLGRIGQILDDVTAGGRGSPSAAPANPPPPRPSPAPSSVESSRGEGSEGDELQRLRGEVRQLRDEVERLKRRLEGLERRVVPQEP